MKRGLLCVVAILLALPSLSFAGIIFGSTDPSKFTVDTVDWCQFGCAGNSFATPKSWIGNLGTTGSVGLLGTEQPFYNLQQGTSWLGDFSNGMGLIYNGVSYGNTPADIVVTYDQGQGGGGAWIQPHYSGAFTATVTAFDIHAMPLFSYSVDWNSTYGPGNPGTALFIGILDSDKEIYALQFDAVSGGTIGPGLANEPDFAIGTLLVPEPSLLLMMGVGLLGLCVFVRGHRS